MGETYFLFFIKNPPEEITSCQIVPVYISTPKGTTSFEDVSVPGEFRSPVQGLSSFAMPPGMLPKTRSSGWNYPAFRAQMDVMLPSRESYVINTLEYETVRERLNHLIAASNS